MNFLFYLFSSLTLLSGIMVIQARNPVHSVLFLILVFFNAAGLLVLLNLDFFAMIFLVVYVGAIAVLFLFVVMMLNIKLAEINEKRLRYLPIGGLLGLLFLFESLLIVDNDLIPLLFYDNIQAFAEYRNLSFIDWSNTIHTVTNIQAIGNILYTYYFYFFFIIKCYFISCNDWSNCINYAKRNSYKTSTGFFTKYSRFCKNDSKNFVKDLIY